MGGLANNSRGRVAAAAVAAAAVEATSSQLCHATNRVGVLRPLPLPPRCRPTYPSQLRLEHVMQLVPDDAELHASLRAEYGTGQRQPGIVGTPSPLPSFLPFGDHLGALAGTPEFRQQFGLVYHATRSGRRAAVVFHPVTRFAHALGHPVRRLRRRRHW